MTNADDDYIANRLPVTSVHAARTIDVVAVLSKVFGKRAPLRHRFGKSSIMVQLPPFSSSLNGGGGGVSRSTGVTTTMKKKKNRRNGGGGSRNLKMMNGVEEKENNDASLDHDASLLASSSSSSSSTSYLHPSDSSIMRYVVVFRFGSVVFFNVAPRESRVILEEIKKYSVDPISSGFEQKERFDLALRPGLEEAESYVDGDFAMLKALDMNNVAVISTIMGQTVALDSYDALVDELLSTFATINTTVNQTGNLTSMERDSLFKVVAKNNSLFIDMVSKLGIKDRSDTAWNLSQYDRVYQGMREEFEIDYRFDHIEFKLNLIQQNAKFFLELLQNQKSNTLEWIIIGLIGLECVLMCLEMSGMGGVLFESLGMDFTSPAVVSSSSSAVVEGSGSVDTAVTAVDANGVKK